MNHDHLLRAALASPLSHPPPAAYQALIDLVGRLRVVVAAVGAVLARLLGRRGVFYQLAGGHASYSCVNRGWGASLTRFNGD